MRSGGPRPPLRGNDLHCGREASNAGHSVAEGTCVQFWNLTVLTHWGKTSRLAARPTGQASRTAFCLPLSVSISLTACAKIVSDLPHGT